MILLRFPLPALLLAALLVAPAVAAPGGKLRTIDTGKWYCELPGDAETPAVAQPGETFTAVADSSYRTEDGQVGTYVRLGTEVTMTSGPRNGERYRMEGDATMHKLDPEGNETPLRCVHAGNPAAGVIDLPATKANR